MNKGNYRILFFDLDGTLLNSEKHISEKTIKSISKCREQGFIIGICTSRSEINSAAFIDTVCPDIIISSGGALVNIAGKHVVKHEFSIQETEDVINSLRNLIGEDCEITVDTIDAHYWNYNVDPNLVEHNWGDSIYSDFSDINHTALKICVEIQDPEKVESFYEHFHEYDCIHFSDGDWYKLTKKGITKENAIRFSADFYGSHLKEIISFGDDYADIGMLKMCGMGIAMGNAKEGVKEIADLVIGSNDEDGIAEFLENYILN